MAAQRPTTVMRDAKRAAHIPGAVALGKGLEGCGCWGLTLLDNVRVLVEVGILGACCMHKLELRGETDGEGKEGER